jgi:hypothetical protein
MSVSGSISVPISVCAQLKKRRALTKEKHRKSDFVLSSAPYTQALNNLANWFLYKGYRKGILRHRKFVHFALLQSTKTSASPRKLKDADCMGKGKSRRSVQSKTHEHQNLSGRYCEVQQVGTVFLPKYCASGKKRECTDFIAFPIWLGAVFPERFHYFRNCPKTGSPQQNLGLQPENEGLSLL